VAVTASAMKHNLDKNACDAVLSKPVMLSELVKVLSEFLPHAVVENSDYNKEVRESRALTTADISCMDKALFKLFSAATRRGDMKTFNSLLNQNRDLPDDIINPLKSLASNFELEYLKSLFKPKEDA